MCFWAATEVVKARTDGRMADTPVAARTTLRDSMVVVGCLDQVALVGKEGFEGLDV